MQRQPARVHLDADIRHTLPRGTGGRNEAAAGRSAWRQLAAASWSTMTLTEADPPPIDWRRVRRRLGYRTQHRRPSSSGGCLERGYRAPTMNLDVDTSGDRSMVDRARRGSGVGKGEVKGAKQTWSCLTFGSENHGTAVSAGSPPRHPRPAGRAPRWQGCGRSLGLGGPSWAGEGDVCSHRSLDGRYFTAAGARGRRGLR